MMKGPNKSIETETETSYQIPLHDILTTPYKRYALHQLLSFHQEFLLGFPWQEGAGVGGKGMVY